MAAWKLHSTPCLDVTYHTMQVCKPGLDRWYLLGYIKKAKQTRSHANFSPGSNSNTVLCSSSVLSPPWWF